MSAPVIRIGQGFDVHRLISGRPLILGGVEIPWHLGLDGHSDADVVIHALCDACLGAVALGDIGRHFPDTDNRYRGMDSRELLRQVSGMLRVDGWALQNADCTIIAEAPKLAPHIQAMRENLSQDLHVQIDSVSIKATTTEKLGFAGREEGIACMASVLVARDGLPERL